MARRRKPRQVVRKAKPAPASARTRRFVPYLKLLLKGFVPVTVLVGIWIYWPRDARPFVPGLGIEAECAMAPEIKMFAQITDTEAYQIILDFGDLSQFSCTELKIVVPADLISVVQLRDIQGFTPEAMRVARRSFTNFRLTRNVLQQPVLSIPTARLGSKPFALELLLRGIIQDSFEKFRLLIPKGVNIDREPKLSIQPRVALYSIAISSRFDTLDVMPQPTSRRRQLGTEILFFNAAALSEINILFLDRVRDTWKTVFNAFALAVAMSVLAATISSLTQSSKGST